MREPSGCFSTLTLECYPLSTLALGLCTPLNASQGLLHAESTSTLTLELTRFYRRVHACLEGVVNTGYANVQVVRDFREELKDPDASSSSVGTPHEI